MQLSARTQDSAFVNLPASSRGAATQMQGYRLDWMIEGYKPDGADGLQTQDGDVFLQGVMADQRG